MTLSFQRLCPVIFAPRHIYIADGARDFLFYREASALFAGEI